MFELKAAAQFCCRTSSSLTELEAELELIVDGDCNHAVGRYGLSDPRDDSFSVGGAKYASEAGPWPTQHQQWCQPW